MALPTFRESDLAVSQKWLDDVSSALASRGDAASVQTVIQEAVQTVSDYSSAYVLPTDRWLRLMRPIAIRNLHALIGQTPKSVEDAYASAIAELEKILAGKFNKLPTADMEAPPVRPLAGAFGSATKLEIRLP